MNMRTIIFALAVLCAAPVAAQEGPKATVTTAAPIFIQPGAQTPLRVATIGTSLRVLQEDGEWLEVEFNDPQFGRRVGWTHKKLVRMSRPELEPMDLSVKEAAPAREAPAREFARPAERPRQHVQDALPAVRALQPRSERGWFDINIGAANAAQTSLTTEYRVPDIAGELETYRIGYKSPTGGAFDFGGGFMFTETVGVGILFAGTAHKSPADLDINLPHPTMFNRFAADSGFTEGDLERVEGAAHIQLMFKPRLSNDNVRLRLFAGPSYFQFKADGVSAISWRRSWNLLGFHEVEIDGYETEEVEATAWGFHAGGDLTYFFTRVFGIGGFARLSRGEVEIDDIEMLADDGLKVKVGGFQGGLGLRFRF
jgi:hypothetical protein